MLLYSVTMGLQRRLPLQVFLSRTDIGAMFVFNVKHEQVTGLISNDIRKKMKLTSRHIICQTGVPKLRVH